MAQVRLQLSSGGRPAADAEARRAAWTRPQWDLGDLALSGKPVGPRGHAPAAGLYSTGGDGRKLHDR